jgi:signal transduction histidine kinase
LLADSNRVVVNIVDDGKGISEGAVHFRPDSIGVGIGEMKQRMSEFGGELSLKNGNPGTIVEAIVPIKAALGLAKPAAPTPAV